MLHCGDSSKSCKRAAKSCNRAAKELQRSCGHSGAAIQQGSDDALAGERAIERVQDLLAQAAEVPDDFARVRAEFESLNTLLRLRVLESGESQRQVLDDVFRGVDLISESDAGRSFAGFSALVLDPALGAAFEDDVRQVAAKLLQVAGECGDSS